MTHRFQAALAKAGIQRTPFHNLRHTCATFQFAMGASVREVMEQLGHDRSQTTLDIYGHILEEGRRASATRMEAALGG